MEVYMIRHGEREANAAGEHSGWSPVSLTAKGREEAQRTAHLLKDLRFDRVFVSDVRRAQQTARILFPDAVFTFVPMMREINNTSMRGMTGEKMTALFGEKYLDCRRKFDYAPLGMDCESGGHLKQRAGQLLRFFEAQGCEKIAAVCHAGIIRACAACVLDTPTHNPCLSCGNASVNVFELRDGAWRIVKWNVT